jgi:HEAT repeat protein
MRFCSKRTLILIFAALTACAPPSFAADAKPTFHASLNAALEAAAAEKTPVLVIISSAGAQSAREVDQALSGETLNKLGALKITHLNTDLNPGLAQKFSVTVLPAFILLGPDGKLVSRHEGFGGVDELLDWLKEARARISRGEWEGTSTAKPIDLLAAKAIKGDLTDDDLAKMAAELANPDPAERAQIAGLLIEQRERAIPPLIQKLSDPYLGVRVAASDVLRQLLPGAPEIDPWLAPKDAAPKLAELQKWWTAAGKIPDRPAQAAHDPVAINSIRAAIDKIKSDDPVVRTEAMSALVRFGNESLPMIREALKRAEKNSDQRTAGFLEEIRWSILIPASAERIAGGVRQPLARGSSPERQSAAAKLGRAGASGIPALAELVNDADPLVVETAVRSLSSIGGSETIPAMAALLKAGNSNLRMTAAQAMGKTKRKEAVPHLLTAADDPNEVVACAAISAIEEIFSKGNVYSNKSIEIPPEVIAALKTSMTDPRWRVRATAVEVAGKLSALEVAENARKLIQDSDPFVVKTTLHALQALGIASEPNELAEVMTRIPSLRPEVIGLMVERNPPDVVKTVHDIYLSSKPDEQISILQNLKGGRGHGPIGISAAWKPTLAHAVNSPNAQLRSAAANLLANTPPEISSDLVAPLLADTDASVRRNAALVVLNLFGNTSGARAQALNTYNSDSEKKFVIPADKQTAWAAALAKSSANTTDPILAVARYLSENIADTIAAPIIADIALGNPVDRLASAFARIDKTSATELANTGAIAALVRKLPWPDAKSVFENLRNDPVLLASAAFSASIIKPEAADFLLEPAVVRATLEKSSEEQANAAIRMMSGSSGWSIYSSDARAKALLPVLLESKHPKWRGVALSVLANANSKTNLALFTSALHDTNDLIRIVAIQGIDGAVPDLAEREKILAPLLADEKQNVRRIAILALIDSDIRDAAQINHILKTSALGGTHFSYTMSVSDEDRPFPAPFPKPSFVASIVEQLPNMNADELPPIALLLAQYGVFDALDRVIANYGAPSPAKFETNNELLVAIGLSKDAKYIPFLRTAAADMKDDYNLRRILRAVKGMTGREAREFRVELNKMMRKTT